jgi:hypothetical protein
MPVRRFLAVDLFVSPLTAFGQSQPIAPASTIQHARDARTASEPWRMLPDDGAKLVSPKDQPGPFKTYPAEAVHEQPQVTTLAAPNGNDFVASPGGTLLDSSLLFKDSQLRGCPRQQGVRLHAPGALLDLPTGEPLPLKSIELQADPPPSR